MVMISPSDLFHCNVMLQFQHQLTKPTSCDLAPCLVCFQPLLQPSTAPPGRRNGPHLVEMVDLTGENHVDCQETKGRAQQRRAKLLGVGKIITIIFHHAG